MVLESNGMCLEYRVLKSVVQPSAKDLVHSILSFQFVSWKPLDATGLLPDNRNIHWRAKSQIRCKVLPREPHQNNGACKVQEELLISKAQLWAQRTPVGAVG